MDVVEAPAMRVGHDCRIYRPKNPSLGTVSKCCCGKSYTFINNGTYRSWKLDESKKDSLKNCQTKMEVVS